MRTLLMLMVFSARACLAQETPPASSQSPTQAQQQVPATPPDSAQLDPTITVPSGTRVELALANPIHRRGTHVGDAVRAVTNFPVTVGQDLVIPQGSFVEGSVVKIGKHGSTRFDGLQIAFKQLIFSNGYNVALDGSVVNATAIAPAGATSLSGAAASRFPANPFQQPPPTPTPPPLPQVGPSKALVTGVSIALLVATMATFAILNHHHLQNQGRDFDVGFQFEIVLEEPLTLDRARVAAAVNGTGGN